MKPFLHGAGQGLGLAIGLSAVALAVTYGYIVTYNRAYDRIFRR